MRYTALLVLSFIIAACGLRGGPGPEDASSAGNSSILEGPEAVVVYPASLRVSPGGGARLGSIQPNIVVKVGAQREGWRQVELEGALKTKAWIQADRLGCRTLRDTELEPLEQGGGKVTLRAGALLAILADHGERLEVETQDPVTKRGIIETSACGVGAPFVPGFPRGATPHKLLREARMVGDAAQGGGVIVLPAGYRFAVESGEGRMVTGRTDGPVVVQGRIERNAVERDRSTPLDILAEPLGYTHEVVLDVAILDAPGGEAVAQIAGGTPITLVSTQPEWVKVRTFGPIQLEGWIETWAVRRVALDHNELEPLARRRIHFPPDRDNPRGQEQEGEEE